MSARRGVRAAVAAVSCATLLAACGLPLGDAVVAPGEVPAAQRLPERISVLPPGPQPDATPRDVVRGFLAAQSSTLDDHGIARRFLAPGQAATWDDDARAVVYDPRTAGEPQESGEGGEVVITLRLDEVGRVEPDGAASVREGRPFEQTYRLARVDGQWRLVEVPAGLTLTPFARDGSFDALDVFHLAPLAPGARRHLVVDRVLLPTDVDRARALVERVLAGPSSGLVEASASASTAAPGGTTLVRLSTSASGEVAVDLSAQAAGLADEQREELSAQLVWTLRQVPAFTRLRLTAGGRPFEVAGDAEAQPSSAWSSFDPSGTRDEPPAYALPPGGQLRLLDGVQDEPPPALAQATGVVEAAVDPRTAALAVLTDEGETRALRTGALADPLEVRLRGAGLRSPSWGSGEQGVWLLRTEDDAVLRVAADGRVTEFDVPDLPPLEGDALLRVSRDGVRVALVTGGELRVGRVVPDEGGGGQVVDLRLLRTDVLDVAWRTGTSLTVLVRDVDPPLLPLVELSVDGTSALASGLVGVAAGDPVSVAAYEDRPVLVEVRVGERSTTYAGDGRGPFEVRVADAGRPAYPR